MGDHLDRIAHHPAFENARRIGTVAAIDMKARDAGYLSDLAPRLRAFFLERGILLRPLANSIYVMPPYAIPAEQLMKVFDAIEEACSLSQACHLRHERVRDRMLDTCMPESCVRNPSTLH